MGRLLRSPLANSPRTLGSGRAVASVIPWMIRRFFLLDSDRKPLACGRLHFNALDEAQVRFMAVDENMRGCGYGSRISQGIGSRGSTSRRSKGRANTRDTITEFYARHGYAVVGEAEALFGCDSACAD